MDPNSIPPHPPSTFPAAISLFPVNYGAVAAPNTTTAAAAVAPVANSAPAPAASDAVSTQHTAPAENLPPYSEMIYAAIEALKEKNGSSKRAIAKYIEQAYPNLPPNHPTMLTYHLQRLKNNGLLVMVKKSYNLPRSDGSPSTAQRGRGRPPKLKPQPQAQPLVQPQVLASTQPEQQQPPESMPNAPQNLQNAEPVWVALGLADEPTEVKKRGRGRPRKSPVAEAVGVPGTAARRGRPPGTGRSRLPKRPGRPPKPKSVTAISNGMKRRPGRPPKGQSKPTVIPFAAPAAAAQGPNSLPAQEGAVPDATAPALAPRRRGRPKKYGVQTLGVAPQAFIGRGRGRGRGGGRGRGAYRSSTGRPVGRPRKGTAVDAAAQKSANEDFKKKLEQFQSKMKESLAVIKSHFNHESPVTAIAAIQELENLATMDINAPLNDDAQPAQQLPQVQQVQPQQPPQQSEQLEFQPQQMPPQRLYQHQLPQSHVFPQPFQPPSIFQQQVPQTQLYQQQMQHVPLQSQPPQLFQPHA